MRIDDEQRRARLAQRHRLLPGARTDDLAQLADDLVALHSTDPPTVYLSLLARMANPALAAVDAALYADRSLIRHHAMRRTLWVATPAMVRRMHAAASLDLVGPERRRIEKMLAESGVTDPAAWLAETEGAILADLAAHGPSSAREMGPRLTSPRQALQLAPGKSYAAVQSAHTRVITLLGFCGALLRARPSSWINGAYRYVLAEDWLPGGLGALEPRAAAAELAGHWLRRFGPATTKDLQWWMGWTLTRTRQALTDCGAIAVEVGTGPAWLAADDLGPVDPEPWVAVLPALDPTTMGWKQRDWYLPAHAAEAFDSAGNGGPTLWVDGRIVGAWAMSRDGAVHTHYFESVAAGRRAELAERMDQLQGWIGPTRFTVRFPSDIHNRLLGKAPARFGRG